MARQKAKSKHYGQVNGWLASPKRHMTMSAAQHQAMNKLTYQTYNGRMLSYKNGLRKNVHTFADGRIFEGTPAKDGTGEWYFTKCSS